MVINVEFFKNAFYEFEAEKFFSLELIKQIMRGFFWTHQAGIAYIVESPKNTYQEDSFSIRGSDPSFATTTFENSHNQVCETYYALSKDREQCISCDTNHFKDCINNRQTNVHSYECWLGFKEIACPLTIDGRVKAILLSGQIIPKKNNSIDDEKVQAIKNNINKKFLDKEIRDKLLISLEKEIEHQKCNDRYSESNLNKLEAELVDLQKILQDIINRIYDQHKSSTTNKLLQDTSNYLASLDFPNEEEWWIASTELLKDVINIFNFNNIYIFNRNESRYRLKASTSKGTHNEIILGSHLIMQLSVNNKIKKINNNSALEQELIKKMSLSDPNVFKYNSPVYIYRQDTFYQQDTYSTFILLIGEIPTYFEDIINQFFKMISTHFAIVGLIYRILETHKNYKTHVGRVAHSFRTPLSCFALDIGFLKEFLKEKPEFNAIDERINDTFFRLKETREKIDYLLDSMSEKRENFNLTELLVKIISDLRPMADNHPCVLKWKEPPPPFILVRGNRDSIYLGLQSVIENAIKYSWKGKYEISSSVTTFTPHEVNFSIEINETHALVVISNYGIGMSESFIEEVLKGTPGTRFEVVDKNIRTGTGWGIPTAVQEFSKNGGWFDLISRPADSETRTPETEYHRYVTYAYAAILLARQKGTSK